MIGRDGDGSWWLVGREMVVGRVEEVVGSW